MPCSRYKVKGNNFGCSVCTNSALDAASSGGATKSSGTVLRRMIRGRAWVLLKAREAPKTTDRPKSKFVAIELLGLPSGHSVNVLSLFVDLRVVRCGVMYSSAEESTNLAPYLGGKLRSAIKGDTGGCAKASNGSEQLCSND